MKRLSTLPSCIIFLCIVLILSVVASCTGEQEQPKVTRQQSVNLGPDTTLLATIADGDKPLKVIPEHSTDPELQNRPDSLEAIFSESGRSVAYVANNGNKFCVVHNKNRGKEYAAVGGIVFSSDGRRVAYPALEAGKWHMVVDGKEGSGYDTVLSPLFSPDGQHVAYQAKSEEKWYIVVDNTPSSGTAASYTAPEFSSDSSLIAYVETAATNSEMRLIVSDLKFATQTVTWSIGDQLFTTNKDKTRIAAVQVVDNKFRVIDFYFAQPGVVRKGQLYDVIEQLTLSDDGVSMSYCALKGRTRLMIFDKRSELLPEGRAPELPVIRPDKKGVGILLGLNNRISLHHSFIKNQEKGKMYEEAASLTYSKSGNYVYTARNGKEWFIVVNGMEGPAFDRVIAPLFTPDGKYVVYRARKEGKRFAVVADAASGKTVRQHPSYEQVSDVLFSTDGKSVEYGVKDGNRLLWKIEAL